MEVGWSTARSGRFISGKVPVSIVQEAGWTPKSVSPPPVFDPRNVHPFASLCTGYKQNKLASINERYYNALEKYSFSEELNRLLILPVHPQETEREVRKRPVVGIEGPPTDGDIMTFLSYTSSSCIPSSNTLQNLLSRYAVVLLFKTFSCKSFHLFCIFFLL